MKDKELEAFLIGIGVGILLFAIIAGIVVLFLSRCGMQGGN